jgi:hypothetical protein
MNDDAGSKKSCKAKSIHYEMESWSVTYQCRVDVVAQWMTANYTFQHKVLLWPLVVLIRY